MERLLKMEHFLQEQNNRLIMSQKEFKEECWRRMGGLISPKVSSCLQKRNENKALMERLLKMEHFRQEQNKRLINSQKEFKEECRMNMEGLLSPRVSSCLLKRTKK